ncbi:MAG TPA: hypothetical protein VLM05_14345 [Mycobacteriales bacterium]|nr:hypothetical protein [Mycobacteriales bacterium]
MASVLVARLVEQHSFGVGSAQILTVPWATLAPLVQAGIIATTCASAQPAAEATAARPVRALQAGVVITLAGIAVGLNSWSGARLTGPITATALNRNLVGLLGLSLLSAWLCGVTLLWVLPVLAMITSLAIGSPAGAGRAWAWVIQPDQDRVALVVALTIAAAGLTCSARIFDRGRALWS